MGVCGVVEYGGGLLASMLMLPALDCLNCCVEKISNQWHRLGNLLR